MKTDPQLVRMRTEVSNWMLRRSPFGFLRLAVGGPFLKSSPPRTLKLADKCPGGAPSSRHSSQGAPSSGVGSRAGQGVPQPATRRQNTAGDPPAQEGSPARLAGAKQRTRCPLPRPPRQEHPAVAKQPDTPPRGPGLGLPHSPRQPPAGRVRLLS